MEMRILACRWNVFVTGLMLVWGAAANAQKPASAGSANVQPRPFNPFDVGVNRLQLNVFGSFEITQSTASSPGSTRAASSSPAPASNGGNQGGLAVGAVRRPNNPPPSRSPFKPPRPHDPPGPPHDPPGPPSERPPVDPPGHRR
jgi:hypothetical protein